MGLKVVTTALHWSPSVPHSPSSSQTLASAFSSPSSKRRSSVTTVGALLCRYSDDSLLLRSQTCYNPRFRFRTIQRAYSARLDSFSEEDFSKQIQELTLRFENADGPFENRKPFDASLDPRDFPKIDEIIPANIEMRANRIEIPLSLRIIKRKKQWQTGLKEAKESAYCSVKKAFSSMVFIIRELQSYTLQMREVLFYEDLQGILARVQNEMNSSFVWLFQQVFSHTPTLMVYVMILLANYSVYSISNKVSLAATVEEVCLVEDESFMNQKFDRTLKLSSLNGKSTAVGGNEGGGGGDYRPVSSGTDGDGKFDESNFTKIIVPDEVSSSGIESVSMWDSIVEETSGNDHGEYFRTELLYQTNLAQEPNNPLILANYAQFIYLVAQDFDRAENYFKRATEVEPKDAEALNKYANFLWMARKDILAAEETYLEAIAAEPSNTYYAANYANFLWNTGGEDTCFPLS
ncbi:hypothetical protein ACJIZ3_017868 [Penstemon smallii]|uniref:Uncharacterized protein n=1 Tax=Penstemon smallii TaxID=265156 RepID=A0ABD3SXC2_9LAMI